MVEIERQRTKHTIFIPRVELAELSDELIEKNEGILGLLWITMSGLNNLIVLPALKGKQVWGWLVRTSSYIHKL